MPTTENVNKVSMKLIFSQKINVTIRSNNIALVVKRITIAANTNIPSYITRETIARENLFINGYQENLLIYCSNSKWK
jgi:hypothetical protein